MKYELIHTSSELKRPEGGSKVADRASTKEGRALSAAGRRLPLAGWPPGLLHPQQGVGADLGAT
jgi:hypothetical protein